MTAQRLLRILIALVGVANVATGLALLFAPQWFFETVGNYPPFNRHYEGDLGSFITAIGVGLVWAARDPVKHRALVGIALFGSFLHLLNHVYDDVLVSASFAQIMQGAIPVGFQMLLLALALYLSGVPVVGARQTP